MRARRSVLWRSGIWDVSVMWGGKVGEEWRDGWTVGRWVMRVVRWVEMSEVGGGVSQRERGICLFVVLFLGR